jgi:cysteine desulfurase / selenocysteine lyase
LEKIVIAKDPELLRVKNANIIVLGNRSIFENLEAKSYLNYAAFSPPSVLTRSIIEAWYQDYSRLGASAYTLWVSQRDRLRERLSELINCEAECIGFGNSTSGLISDVTLMLDWKKNDRVLVFNGDFPSVIYPVKNAVQQFGLELVMHELDGFGDHSGSGLERIETELKKGLRLIALSSTQFHTGLLLPIKQISELCHKYGAEILVDAAQSCGAIDFSITDENIDYLMAPTHKWLMGIEGAAFIYISNSAMERLVFRRTGWMSYENGLDFLFGEPNKMSYQNNVKKRSSFVELGMSNSIGFAALEAGISAHLSIGMKNITNHIQQLHDRIEIGLTKKGYQSMRADDQNSRSSILSFLPPTGIKTADLAKKFSDNSVSISTPDGYLRFAPSWPTNITEVDYMLNVASSF